MATYVVLTKFTDQGIRKAKDLPKRAEAFKQMAKAHGATVKEHSGRRDNMTLSQSSRHQMRFPLLPLT